MPQVTASLSSLTFKNSQSLLLWNVNNHHGRYSIPSKQQGESIMCIPLIIHGKDTQPSKFCDTYLGILVATLVLGSGKQSVTKNIMSQPPLSQLTVIFSETEYQRGMEHFPKSLLSCTLQCATCRFQSNPSLCCKIIGFCRLHPG